MKYSNDNFRDSFRLKYIKLFCLKSILIFLIASCEYSNANTSHADELQKDSLHVEIRVGAYQMDAYLSLLSDKNIGVVGNQSSMLGETHLVDTLLSRGIHIKKVFSPEHGFRGKADAGEHVKNEIDEVTKLPIISLYGKNKKPTKEQLQGIDVMVFDIQDVGVRFYTYISTLHYVMEACAEQNIPLVILDRPNPNGHYVDGPVLDLAYKSFVGMHQVPIVHGMTIGEYGQMINGEGWLKDSMKCELTVIPCQNYNHQMNYSLPIAPSPNLKSDVAITLYPSLCLLEATTVSVGRGTEAPFEIYGHPDFTNTDFSFTPEPNEGSKSPKHKGVTCHGYDLRKYTAERMDQINLGFVIKSNDQLKGKLFVNKEKFFNLLAGNGELIKQIQNGMSEREIKATWQEDLDTYKEMRKNYLIYTP